MTSSKKAAGRGSDGDIVTLRSADARLEAAPGDGGTLVSWSVSGIDILRRRACGQRDPLQSACFPLAPFSNVILGGGFHFRGQFHPMAPNHPAEPHPIHGDAWLRSWNIETHLRDHLCLSYIHTARFGFPYRYHIIQRFSLAARSLLVTLFLTNVDRRPMPAGLGLHPYFPRVPRIRLKAPHQGRWDDSRALPDHQFRRLEQLPHEALDTCFTGWTGQSCIRWPSNQVAVKISASQAARVLVVYAPASSDFVCVEPVTHVNDGFNAFAKRIPQTGIRLLSPGKSLGMDVQFDVSITPRTSLTGTSTDTV